MSLLSSLGPLGPTFIKPWHADIYPAISPLSADLSQRGKAVLITGAGRGIGRSMALRYAECAVSVLILCARSAGELAEVASAARAISPEVAVHTFTVDVTDADAVRAAAERVSALLTATGGGLHVLVNNAGATSEWCAIADSDPAAYWRTWEVNFKGVYLFTRFFVPLLVAGAAQRQQQHRLQQNSRSESREEEEEEEEEEGGGKKDWRSAIVNVSSIGAEQVSGRSGASAYSTSKFALARLGEYTQCEYEASGVDCFTLHPGGVRTRLAESVDAVKDYLNDTPELAAGFVAWLTRSDTAWLGGRFLYVNWDVEELVRKRDEIVAGDLLKMRLAV